MENEKDLINTKRKRDWINAQNILLKPIKIKFDILTLNMIIAFVFKDSVLRNRKNLNYFKRLLDHLEMSIYTEPQLITRIWIIKTAIDILIDVGISDQKLLKIACQEHQDESRVELSDELINDILKESDNYKITHDESKYLINKICDMLKFGYTVTIKEVYQELLNKLDDEDFRSYKALEKDLNDIAISTISIHRKNTYTDNEQSFSLEDETFTEVVEDSVNKLKDRNRIFMTGIKKLNVLLAPGYMSKRLYMYLAFPGKGKSTILLKSALDIKRYNKNIKTKDPNKRPAVLLLTLENDVPETIERLYNMTVDSDDIRNYTPKQVITKLKKEGHLGITKDDPIDIIIQEYPNQSINTEDIYGIIEDLTDQGVEVVALVLDYIKRIRPTIPGANEKEDLKNISNELKTLAKTKDIAVITAQQLNRSGAAVVDAALQANKTDITRLVGRDAIASAWELLENADWTCIINPELKADTDTLYLTFKLLKRRYRSNEGGDSSRRLDYFNHPFEKGNEIKLIDDYDAPKSLSLLSLTNTIDGNNIDMNNVSGGRGPVNAVPREEKKKPMDFVDDYEPFDMDQAINY